MSARDGKTSLKCKVETRPKKRVEVLDVFHR